MYKSELNLACSAVKAGLEALNNLTPDLAFFGSDASCSREMKSAADEVLESIILNHLYTSGINVLSEEGGHLIGEKETSFRWILDPLDGTVNFIRGLAPCAISLALCDGDIPILGVIGEYPSGKIAWGGINEGAFISGNKINVSKISDRNQSVLCTGFPSRFKFDENGKSWVTETLGQYAKVRMLGAASLSLLSIAKGSAEVYHEKNIMIWDVAAGLAIVEGAGGSFTVNKNPGTDTYDVFASNGLVLNN